MCTLTIQWVREIISMDNKIPDQTEVHIRSDTLAEKTRSHSSRTLFAQQRRCRCCWKNVNHKGFSYSPQCNARLIRPIDECFGVKRGRFNPWANRPQRSSTTAYFTAWTSSSFDEAMGDFNEKIMLVSHRKLWTETWFALNFEVTTTVS